MNRNAPQFRVQAEEITAQGRDGKSDTVAALLRSKEPIMRDARGAAKAVQLLDLLEEFFDGGKMWTRGDLWDGHGRRCIRGAMEYLRRRHAIRWDPTAYYLLQAIPGGWPLISFNDVVCRDYAPVLP